MQRVIVTHVFDRNEVLSLEILDHRMIFVIATWRARKGCAAELKMARKLSLPAYPNPFTRLIADSFADSRQRLRIRVPHAGADKYLLRIHVHIETG